MSWVMNTSYNTTSDNGSHMQHAACGTQPYYATICPLIIRRALNLPRCPRSILPSCQRDHPTTLARAAVRRYLQHVSVHECDQLNDAPDVRTYSQDFQGGGG